MSKKNRGKAPKNSPGAGARIAIGLLAALGLAAGVFYWKAPAPSSTASLKARVPGGERRPTLSPVLFTGVVAQAYQVAREIPQILDQLYCWCQCVEGHGHKSNLSCFADSHAAG
ncbi:MAG: hypothetical protein A3J27_15840 [Candidatus Tectomicrobia bacterium RIFCSPLOWO2_12_FULL_69_37]|nr:MAG: hypothetical protein A3I72_15070 [Candidatus Tectomicrobia bacterium RIFCSPLOWO2_02_FULL_70_19]OGL66039.1 MAG: hypothetical protein A3J27_15840 [Candidatus Tectomicrobia bacterium RIFCSPLOWO2_12_FULL_69_37]